MPFLVLLVSAAFVLDVTFTSLSAIPNKMNSSDQQELIKPSSKDIKQERCKPFTEVRHGCFACLCLFTELSINPKLCTLKYCNEKGELIVKDDAMVGAKCKPAAVFRRGACLKCTCPGKGTISATSCSYVCDDSGTVIPQFDKCITGTIFAYGCNYCICTDRSTVDRFSCSQTTCNTTSKDLKIKGKMAEIKSLTLTNINIDKVCEPGTLIKVRCNLCECNKDGVVAPDRCTLSKCDRFWMGDSCIPGERFRSGCLACTCPEKGVVETTHCSRKLCKDPSRRLHGPTSQPANGDSCRPGVSFKAGCRLCKCPMNGIVDLSVCAVIQNCAKSAVGRNRAYSLPTGMDCVPQTIFQHGCNTCICPLSGKLDLSQCSNKKCAEYEQTISKSEVLASNMNSMFVNLTEVPRPGEKCLPHRHHRFQCTVCYCPPIGRFDAGMCMNDTCDKGTTQNVGYVAHVTTSVVENANCTPNTTYQIDCSICFCPSDGKVDLAWCTDDCESNVIAESKVGPLRAGIAPCSPENIKDGKCTGPSTLAGADATAEPGNPTNLNCTDTDTRPELALKPMRSQKAESKMNQTRTIINGRRNAGASESPSNICPAGKEYSPNPCLLCECPKSGLEDLSLCAKVEGGSCISRRMELEDVPALTKSGGQCKVAELIQLECNYCRCPQNGYLNMAHCTRFKCSVPTPLQEGDACHVGSLFYLDCNLCRCGSTGRAKAQFCTKRNCSEKILPTTAVQNDWIINSANYISSTVPVANSSSTSETFLQDDASLKCRPLGIVKVTCNVCWCNALGRLAECTKNICKNDLQTGVGSSKTGPKDTLKKDNTIGYMYDGKPCIANSIYKWNCNYCTCPMEGFMNDGNCTKLKCERQDVVRDLKNEEVAVNLESNADVHGPTTRTKEKTKKYRIANKGVFGFSYSRKNL